MSTIKPSTKEQLIYYLLQNLSLGTYDRRFINNLQDTNITDNRPLTSNQAALLDKIVLRYAKQLRKFEVDAELMVQLPWTLQPIQSLPEYTDAFCSVKENVIEVRSPFKKEFITDIKDIDMTLTWDKDTKVWSAPYSELALKHFINCLDKHYEIVRFDEHITNIINTFVEFESATCWNPTYMKVNGNLMIAGINGPLAEAIKHITLDTTPSTLARLAECGIEIDSSITQDLQYDPKLLSFALDNGVVFDRDNIPQLVSFLKDINCDFAIITDALGRVSNKVSLLEDLLIEANIKITKLDKKSTLDNLDTASYDYPVLINTALWTQPTHSGLRTPVCKTIFLANNNPIEIR